jgi:hypothetical protein
LIDRLEELLDRSTRIPATSRVIIDEDEYLRLIDQMRISVPQEIKSARAIENDRDSIIASAQAQAEAMIQAGREKADALSAEHEVTARAEVRAEQILSDARIRADSVKAAADVYVLDVLQGILQQIDAFRTTVANGVAKVSQESQAAAVATVDDRPSSDEA